MEKEFKKLNIEEINIILPKRLKHFRKRTGLTLREVAKKIDKSPGQVSLWERGINPPSCIDLFKLCLIYDIIFPDLFPEVSENVKPVKDERELIKKYRVADREVKTIIHKILDYAQNKQEK